MFKLEMFHCSIIRCSTDPASDVLLFYHLWSAFFHYQVFYCFTISLPLIHHHLCSTVTLSDVPLFDHQMIYRSVNSVPLFQNRCSTVPPLDVLLFHHQMFHCSAISVPLFHHQMFYCSAISVLLFHRQMFFSFTIALPLFRH